MRNLISPVYKNIENLPDPLEALENLWHALNNSLNVTFVVDASPDDSEANLLTHLPSKSFPSIVIRYSRIFCVSSYFSLRPLACLNSFQMRIGLSIGNGNFPRSVAVA